jgi:hypothetical protein
MKIREADHEANVREFRHGMELAHRFTFDPAFGRGKKAHWSFCQCIHVSFCAHQSGVDYGWWFFAVFREMPGNLDGLLSFGFPIPTGSSAFELRKEKPQPVETKAQPAIMYCQPPRSNFYLTGRINRGHVGCIGEGEAFGFVNGQSPQRCVKFPVAGLLAKARSPESGWFFHDSSF